MAFKPINPFKWYQFPELRPKDKPDERLVPWGPTKHKELRDAGEFETIKMGCRKTADLGASIIAYMERLKGGK